MGKGASGETKQATAALGSPGAGLKQGRIRTPAIT